MHDMKREAAMDLVNTGKMLRYKAAIKTSFEVER
jgi:hypothetical protein